MFSRISKVSAETMKRKHESHKSKNLISNQISSLTPFSQLTLKQFETTKRLVAVERENLTLLKKQQNQKYLRAKTF